MVNSVSWRSLEHTDVGICQNSANVHIRLMNHTAYIFYLKRKE